MSLTHTDHEHVDDASGGRGRPRSADRTTAILDAAVDQMHEVGWDNFRVQDVAQRAGAGLATIYRRWPTKEDLVAAAMRHDTAFDVDLTGDARTDLSALLRHFGDKMCGKGGSIISVLAAARDHDAMRSALHETVRDEILPTIRSLVEQLIGHDHPQAATLTDALMATMLLRSGMLEEDTPGDEYAAEMMALVDAVAAGSS